MPTSSMELLEGQTLKDRIAGRPLETEMFLALAIDRPGELATAVLRRRPLHGEKGQDTSDQDRAHPAIMITPSSANQS